MPWRVKDKVELRLEFIRRAERGENISKLCREYGISRPTGYLWLKRYQTSGTVWALEDRSHRPQHCPHRIEWSIEKRVIKLRERYGWGARKLQSLLVNEDISLPVVTINRIIARNGLLVPGQCHRPAEQRFERQAPNELWQTDLKGSMGHGQARCEPLSIIDDHSRFSVGLHPVRTSALEPIQGAFQRTFQEYGVPAAMLMDHGNPWWGTAQIIGLTRLSVWLMRQDIELIFSGYNHPQTQGKVERFHRTLAHAVYHVGIPKDFKSWAPLLRRFRKDYNHVRPHEALGMQVPASRYTPSRVPFKSKPPEVSYPSGSKVVKIDSLGRFSFGKRRLFASAALANEFARIEELQSSLLVYYRKTIIREIDLRTGETIQPINSQVN